MIGTTGFSSSFSFQRGMGESEFVQFRSDIHQLVNRAYFNLHGRPMAEEDPQWVTSIVNAALQCALHDQSRELSQRQLVTVFEDMIRVSEEHYRLARQHMAKANNTVYLRQVALDMLEEREEAPVKAAPHITTRAVSFGGRVDSRSQEVLNALNS